MNLKLYKPLWGFTGSYHEAAEEAWAAGFDGIEGPVPVSAEALTDLSLTLESFELDFIAEICTGGDYVPHRGATPEEHLRELEQAVIGAKQLKPRLCNLMTGCDAWALPTQYAFFDAAQEIGAKHGVVLSFETHRSRSMFTPWVTDALIQHFPQLKVTADISHWVNVCERLLEHELDWDVLTRVAQQVHHLHARVGYPQGPQVPHPAAPEYSDCLAFHQRFWEVVWRSQQERGYDLGTMTPEFGPDRYLHTLPFTDQPVSDLWQMNCWMANTEREHFQRYTSTFQTESMR